MASLQVDIWSDIVCPWCAIGRVRLRKALQEAGVEATIRHRAFELEPNRKEKAPTLVALQERYGSEADVEAMTGRVRELAAEEGLTLDTAHTISVNTFDAHRLLQWAQSQGRGEAMMDHLVKAHFEDLWDLSDHATLVGIAKDCGLDGDAAQRLLADPQDSFALQVRADEEAATLLGIHAVPFFVIADRYGVSGAQSVATFQRAIAAATKPQ